ncbi:MAG TPA: hypothetical protein VJH95_05770 [Candidatus Nanoarchaeia archaeon]|nr:hypothetical protein [Candidatus Nanoarchaeia archaeon]
MKKEPEYAYKRAPKTPKEMTEQELASAIATIGFQYQRTIPIDPSRNGTSPLGVLLSQDGTTYSIPTTTVNQWVAMFEAYNYLFINVFIPGSKQALEGLELKV